MEDLEAQSKIFDPALALLCSYHIVEWFRMTLFLVTLILGVNLFHFWYILGLNTLYGFAVHIYIHVARFSEPGSSCADIQKYRAAFLICDIVVFWTTFHIMSFPHAFFFCMKKENLEDAMKVHEEEEEEEGGDTKKD